MTVDELARALGLQGRINELKPLFPLEGGSDFMEIATAEDEYIFEFFDTDEVINDDEIPAIGDAIAVARDAGDWLLCLTRGDTISAFILDPAAGKKVALFDSIEALASRSNWM